MASRERKRPEFEFLRSLTLPARQSSTWIDNVGHNLNFLRFLPIAIGLVIMLAMGARSCKEGPFGRSQLISMSPEQDLQLGRQAYQQILAKDRGNVLPPNEAIVIDVREVGNRLRRAAEDPEIRKKLGLSSDVKFEWEFNVIRSKQINAFCLPGGKVAVYTGILPVCQTDTGLAVVMGHEIGHALARHGAERMTQQEMVNIAQMAVASSLGGMDYNTQRTILGLMGAGAQVGVLLPFSRHHESEADHIGIILMAAAGYDPREASRFWIRMSEMSKGSGGPEFMSTHPSHETRVNDLVKWTQEALPYFESHPHAPNADRPLPPIGQTLYSPSKPTPKLPPTKTKGPGWEIK